MAASFTEILLYFRHFAKCLLDTHDVIYSHKTLSKIHYYPHSANQKIEA